MAKSNEDVDSKLIEDPNLLKKILSGENSQRRDSVIPIDITWYRLNVHLRTGLWGYLSYFFPSLHQQNTHIIKNASGQVKRGTLCALMGSSGCGKTTLLNGLTGRNLASLIVQGSVRLNGALATPTALTSCSAYIQQDDTLIGVLTVREHLKFQAYLRIGKSTKTERMKRVEDVIHELGLKSCADTLIGIRGSKKSISGGQMKRLAFASEILTNPSILFCDEPTSGLDSFMAYSVVSVLKDLAARQRTVILTIHQPASAILEMFDQIMLLADGRMAFMGSLSEATQFFTQLELPLPVNYNPAEFFIEKLSIVTGREEESLREIDRICRAFQSSEYAQGVEKVGAEMSKGVRTFDSREHLPRVYKRSIFNQFIIILWRCSLCNIREYSVTTSKLTETIFISLIVGLIYYDQIYDQIGIMNINGALFMLLVNNSFIYALSVINTFGQELPVFFREYHAGLYRVSVYFICKTLAEAPFYLILPTTSIGISYWLINLNNNARSFGLILSVIILSANVATSFGYFISCSTSSIKMALSMIPSLLTPIVIFGGLAINHETIPFALAWGKYISWIFYGYEIVMVAQWEGVENISCAVNVKKYSQSNVSTITTAAEQMGCINTGEMILERLNFDKKNLNRDFIAMVVLFFVLRFGAFCALHGRAQMSR